MDVVFKKKQKAFSGKDYPKKKIQTTLRSHSLVASQSSHSSILNGFPLYPALLTDVGPSCSSQPISALLLNDIKMARCAAQIRPLACHTNWGNLS